MASVSLISASGGLILLAGVVYRIAQSRTWAFQLGPDGPRDAGDQRVSIIIPARNEAETIPDCLPTILNQTYENIEVIVVDDRSTDRTREILSEFDDERLTVVEGEPAPDESWTGKCWAVHQGLQQATGDWLLFTDADMTFEPWLLERVMADHDGRRDRLYSLIPNTRCEYWWNKLLLPLHGFIIFLGFPVGLVNDPESRTAIAVGGFMLMHRELHESVGGHKSVRGEIAEDLAMGKRVKETGGRITLKSTVGLNSRYYGSPRELIDGISKHVLASPVDPRMAIPLGQAVLYFFLFVPVFSVLLPNLYGTPGWYLSAVLVGFVHFLYAGIQNELEHHPLWGTLIIPALAIYSVVGWYSLYLRVRYGGPTWKGRRVTSS